MPPPSSPNVDHVPALIRTTAGVVPSGPIQDALGTIDAVALAVAYGVPTRDGSSQIPCAAVTLRAGRKLGPEQPSGRSPTSATGVSPGSSGLSGRSR